LALSLLSFAFSGFLSFCLNICSVHFFFNAAASSEIYTLSLHDALPILTETGGQPPVSFPAKDVAVLLFLLRRLTRRGRNAACGRSEEHTSELQSRFDLVCRLLLEKKNEYNLSSNKYKMAHVLTAQTYIK